MGCVLKGGLSACLAVWSVCGEAQSLDPHVIYEQKCAACHTPHAGEFVESSLGATDQGLIAKSSNRLLRDFLDGGHGRLSAPEVDVLMEQFEFMRESGSLFRDKCIICHDNAARFARLKLILREDVLTGRYSGREIATFLLGHGRLEASEAERMVEVLTRQLETR